MITKEQASEFLDDYMRTFEDMSYLELANIVDTQDGTLQEKVLHHAGTEVAMNAQPTRYGLRSRIAVEIFLDAEGVNARRLRTGHYIEVFPSGQIKRFDKFGAADAALFLFLLVGLIGIGYGIVQVVRWFL